MDDIGKEFGLDDIMLDGLDSSDEEETPIAPILPETHSLPFKSTLLHTEDDEDLLEKAPLKRMPFSTKVQQNLKFSKVYSVKVRPGKMYDPDNEIKNLQERLRLQELENERMTLAKLPSPNIEDCSLHLAFMFASPLVRKIYSTLDTLIQLDYYNEIADIEKSLKTIKNEVRYKVQVATSNNFRNMIADSPFALHFTGHGLENNQKSLGTAYEIHKNKGDILVLEDENGMADYLFETDLKKLVQLSNARNEFAHNYEVVFVSSCHSERTGKIFWNAGANHVICIKSSETILDKASLIFSRAFYKNLFMNKYSV